VILDEKTNEQCSIEITDKTIPNGTEFIGNILDMKIILDKKPKLIEFLEIKQDELHPDFYILESDIEIPFSDFQTEITGYPDTIVKQNTIISNVNLDDKEIKDLHKIDNPIFEVFETRDTTIVTEDMEDIEDRIPVPPAPPPSRPPREPEPIELGDTYVSNLNSFIM